MRPSFDRTFGGAALLVVCHRKPGLWPPTGTNDMPPPPPPRHPLRCRPCPERLRAVRITGLSLAWLVVLPLFFVVLSRPAAHAAQPLVTAIADPAEFAGPDAQVAFDRSAGAGASVVRIFISWTEVAPQGYTKPAGFDARNPADPQYRWEGADRQIRLAVARGLTPIVGLAWAPGWAETASNGGFTGAGRPDPREYGDFAHAAARRYGGAFADLPRVRYWEAWNEPNLFVNLLPQYDTPLSEPVSTTSKPLSGNHYRRLLNAFAASVHRVHRNNVVIGGGLAPFARYGAREHGVAPMVFMRQMLCMTQRNRPKRGCRGRAHLDVWSHHPYTEGGPTHRADSPDNVSLGDLPRMRRLLRAAIEAGHIQSRRKVRFWVTEFAWDTDPPDPNTVPLKLHGRWVAEALYRMWLNRISLVTWFQIRDDYRPDLPKPAEYTAGLYFRCLSGPACDTPKPALTAFRFPFVAFKSRNGTVAIWGRTPAGQRARVLIEQRRDGGWRRLARRRTDRFGIFQARLPAGAGPLRATGAGFTSLPFSLKRPPDRQVSPF